MLLSESAKERIVEMWRDFCLKYDSDPEILVEPTVDEEINALKRVKPDLVVPHTLGTGAWWYESHGFPALFPNRLIGYFFRIGYWTVVDAAIETRRAIERKISRKAKHLLTMLEQDTEYLGLSKYWGENARVFRDMWYS